MTSWRHDIIALWRHWCLSDLLRWLQWFTDFCHAHLRLGTTDVKFTSGGFCFVKQLGSGLDAKLLCVSSGSKLFEYGTLVLIGRLRVKENIKRLKAAARYLKIQSTVNSRYLEIGYLEFCETRRVYLYQKYILIAFSNHKLCRRLFYKSKLPEVQINLHFG